MADRDKAAKFVELANKRVNRAIKDLQLVGNLSNRQNYEFTDQQAQKIIRRLQSEVDSIKNSFQEVSQKNNNDFQL